MFGDMGCFGDLPSAPITKDGKLDIEGLTRGKGREMIFEDAQHLHVQGCGSFIGDVIGRVAKVGFTFSCFFHLNHSNTSIFSMERTMMIRY
ncbi:hypothetical protein SAMN02982927_02672 [Sporolactobacillus nakayamae]|uniref:Uncharacterized protein n=1 Tax=Sporolactobacillus nakayamae TaxID=269670 RepID=A0A1I2UEE9_9BACL|nr:hypothetical protein SAMN02982927_02672 [Sporolactobacillus nakayamae]